MLGVRRETVTLHLHRLSELRVVERIGSHHYRIDEAGLQKLIEEPQPPAAG
jgi:Mn-dependent DtxR family transcriptional regulator